MQWSSYQSAIFMDVSDGLGHTVVEALAGSGKTTVIIEALRHIPKGCTWLLVAFNKKIAEELKSRAPNDPLGSISTLHSLGLKSLGRTFKKITVDTDKLDRIVDQILTDNNHKNAKELKYQLCKAISLSKAYLVSNADEADVVLDTHDIEPLDIERDQFIQYILTALDYCKADYERVDFDDMVWLPNVLKVDVPKHDRVFTDESQDLNRAQIGLVLKSVQPEPKTKRSKPAGRITIIGDKNQAIYSFCGADQNAIEYFKTTLKAKSLPLSITYRCPQSVVRAAQKFVPQLEAAPGAKEGQVQYIDTEEMKKIARPGCFILSRLNAPLIGLALGFLKQKTPCNIQGRDLGANLLGMIKRSRCKDLNKFVRWVEKWSKREITRLIDRKRDTSIIKDKAECLYALVEAVNSIEELKTQLGRLFSDVDDNNKIILSTTHRAKGLERDIVFMLTSTYRYTDQEEKNLQYVAITRSKDKLYFVKNTKVDKESSITSGTRPEACAIGSN